MQDLIERLDAELSQAPDPAFDIPGTLVSGRRAVRRRRLVVGAAGLAVAVVVGGTAALAFDDGGTSRGRDGHTAGEPTRSPSATATSDGGPPRGEGQVVPLYIGLDGAVKVPEGADVVERAHFTASTGAEAEIVHVGLDGEEYYALAATADSSVSWTPLPAQGLTLREWAEQQLTVGEDDGAADRAWVRLDERWRVRGLPGVRVVEQIADPGLGENFAPAGEPTVVAEVVRDGYTYFLAVRKAPDGGTEAIPYRKDDRITTLDAFLSYARDKYATNEQGGSEGLR
ncbi:MAG TPA: hypothetical protein VM575_04165 [Nocardioides sp.]|nr:hypothetical protein [Nocardioides sp.]